MNVNHLSVSLSVVASADSQILLSPNLISIQPPYILFHPARTTPLVICQLFIFLPCLPLNSFHSFLLPSSVFCLYLHHQHIFDCLVSCLHLQHHQSRKRGKFLEKKKPKRHQQSKKRIEKVLKFTSLLRFFYHHRQQEQAFF